MSALGLEPKTYGLKDLIWLQTYGYAVVDD